MSLIRCPECKKKISDTVIHCPKCGYSILANLPSINADLQRKARKRNRRCRKIKRIVKRMVITSIMFVLLVVFAYSLDDGEIEKYPLFEDDYYVTANKILGKEIHPILNGYIENKDYTITTSNDYVFYTFPLDYFELGSEAVLVIYTDPNTSKISTVHYSFRKGNFANYASGIELMPRLTEYYDAEPVYTYLDSNKNHIKISKYEFGRKYKTTFFITWQSSKGKAVYSITNLYSDKKEYGNFIFTKN